MLDTEDELYGGIDRKITQDDIDFYNNSSNISFLFSNKCFLYISSLTKISTSDKGCLIFMFTLFLADLPKLTISLIQSICLTISSLNKLLSYLGKSVK